MFLEGALLRLTGEWTGRVYFTAKKMKMFSHWFCSLELFFGSFIFFQEKRKNEEILNKMTQSIVTELLIAEAIEYFATLWLYTIGGYLCYQYAVPLGLHI